MWRFHLNISKGFCLAKATWFLISSLSAVCHLLSWSFLSMNPLLKAAGKGCASCWSQRQKHGYCPRMCRTAQNDRYRERKNRNKVEGVNGKQFLSLIGLQFFAIFVSIGSQNFVLHSLVPFFALMDHRTAEISFELARILFPPFTFRSIFQINWCPSTVARNNSPSLPLRRIHQVQLINSVPYNDVCGHFFKYNLHNHILIFV